MEFNRKIGRWFALRRLDGVDAYTWMGGSVDGGVWVVGLEEIWEAR